MYCSLTLWVVAWDGRAVARWAAWWAVSWDGHSASMWAKVWGPELQRALKSVCLSGGSDNSIVQCRDSKCLVRDR